MGAYVFATSRFGAKKSSSCVSACQIPITANSVAWATAMIASTRGSQGGNGARATTATRAVNGSRKKARVVVPASRSLDQRSERAA
jgi:hypothetical protein